MTTVYILNKDTGTIHSKIDGRTLEVCNVDDIRTPKTFYTLEFAKDSQENTKLCKRCFPKGKSH